MKQLSSTIFATLVFVVHYSNSTLAQAPAQAPAWTPPLAFGPPPTQPLPQPPAQAPALPGSGSGSTNITKILEKSGKYTTFIRLLQSTQMDAKINSQLNNSNQLTVFVPTDTAFSKLKSGSLNSFNDAQKAELIQFHIINSFISIPQFQTTSNPILTQAGSGKRFMLNVTATGSQVSLTTGAVTASIADTLYSDNQLALYQVDKVLLPLDFVLPPPPAPSPEKPKKETPLLAPKTSSGDSQPVPTTTSSGTSTSTTTTSAATSLMNPWMHFMFVTVLSIAAISSSTV